MMIDFQFVSRQGRHRGSRGRWYCWVQFATTLVLQSEEKHHVGERGNLHVSSHHDSRNLDHSKRQTIHDGSH